MALRSPGQLIASMRARAARAGRIAANKPPTTGGLLPWPRRGGGPSAAFGAGSGSRWRLAADLRCTRGDGLGTAHHRYRANAAAPPWGWRAIACVVLAYLVMGAAVPAGAS